MVEALLAKMEMVAVGCQVTLVVQVVAEHSGIGHKVDRVFLVKDIVVDHRQSAMDLMVNIG